jgi:hypothetical protein
MIFGDFGASIWPEYMLHDPVAPLYFSFLERYLDFATALRRAILMARTSSAENSKGVSAVILSPATNAIASDRAEGVRRGCTAAE